MKKIFSLMLITMMCLILTGCGTPKWDGYYKTEAGLTLHIWENKPNLCSMVFNGIDYSSGSSNNDYKTECTFKVTGDEIVITLNATARNSSTHDDLNEVKLFGKFSHDFEKLEFEENNLTYTRE